MHLYLSDRPQQRQFNNDKLLLSLIPDDQVESYLAINNNNNKINATYNKKLDELYAYTSVTIATLLIWKKRALKWLAVTL